MVTRHNQRTFNSWMGAALFLMLVFHGPAVRGFQRITDEAPSDGKPAADSKENESESPPDLRPCSFQQITPGETQSAKVLELLGQPAEEVELDGERVLTYKIEPFKSVDILVAEDKVSSIVLHLTDPASPHQIATELGLEKIDAAPVYGETGQLLGRAYPERGVLMNFSADSKSAKVSQLVLEPVGPDPFVLRVEYETRHRYELSFADLETALRLDPSHADALSWKAALLAATDQTSKALEVIEQALQFAPGDPGLRIQRAELLSKLERHDEASTAAKDILAEREAGAIHHARAECLLGDILARGPERDYRRAIEHHLTAIKLATPLASDRFVKVRKGAKHILFHTFLAAAYEIAAGNWQQRETTNAKWLASARELAESMNSTEEGDDILKLRLQIATLESHAAMQSDIDPAQLLAGIDKEIKRLKEESGDRLLERSLAMRHAQALFHAASIEEGRDGRMKSFEYASRAAEMIKPVDEGRELTPTDRYVVGRLYFFIGSCQAVVHKNHAEAVVWYVKAQKYLDDTLPPSAAADLGRHGERFVSMGASYWETGKRDEGLDFTRRGLEMMRQAARRGLINEDKLALPYGNLAAMFELLGKSDEAKTYSETASRLNKEQPRRQ